MAGTPALIAVSQCSDSNTLPNGARFPVDHSFDFGTAACRAVIFKTTNLNELPHLVETYRRANPVSNLGLDARGGYAQSIVGSGRKRGALARHADSVKKSLGIAGAIQKARASGKPGLVRKGKTYPGWPPRCSLAGA